MEVEVENKKLKFLLLNADKKIQELEFMQGKFLENDYKGLIMDLIDKVRIL